MSLACLITIPTFITLVTLFFWTVTSNIFGDEADNGGWDYHNENSWWDNVDMKPEKIDGIKLVLNLLLLAIASGTLLAPISLAESGQHMKFNEGSLAASMFMFGNLLFVSFWYHLNINGDMNDGENNNNNGNNYGEAAYWNLDARELSLYHEKVVAYVCLALALAFFCVSSCTYGWARALPTTRASSTLEPTNVHDHAHIVAQFDILSEGWTFISLCTIVIFISLSIASCLLLNDEDADRMREKARLINLIIINVWMVIVTIFMMVWGNEVFNIKKWSASIGMGLLYGGTKYFSSLLLLVCILFANLSLFDDRERQEGVWVATATSLACLFLSLMHLMYSMKVRKYQISVLDLAANEEKVGGDFVRVEDHPTRGIQLT